MTRPTFASGLFGGVSIVKAPDTNRRAAVSTARRTVGSRSEASVANRRIAGAEASPRSPVDRATHARMAGSGSFVNLSSEVSSSQSEPCNVQSAAKRASRVLPSARSFSRGAFVFGSRRSLRSRCARRRCQTFGCLSSSTSLAPLSWARFMFFSGRLGTGLPVCLPTWTTRQMRPYSRSTPSGSALAFW